MMPPRQQRRACGRVDGTEVEMIQLQALCPEFVERRYVEFWIAMATQASPSHVVDKWWVLLMRYQRREQEGGKECEGVFRHEGEVVHG